MNIRELRAHIGHLERAEIEVILVEMYKVMPKVIVEEKEINKLLANPMGYLDARKQAKATVNQAGLDNHVPNSKVVERKRMPLQQWEAIPKDIRNLLLHNVWCTRCMNEVAITDYQVEATGPDIVLRGRCAVCGGSVARVVEQE